MDAFTDKPYTGNPAGVVVDADGLNEQQMQKIATELNLSETAFVFFHHDEQYDVEVRFFTPTEEVDLCGHATIATFYLLRELDLLDVQKNEFIQKTKAGYLEVCFEDDKVIMRQDTPRQIDKKLELAELAKVMNISLDDIGSEIMIHNHQLLPEIWTTGLKDILMPVKSAQALRNMSPNMEKLSKFSKELDVVGVHAFFLDEDKVICRNFAPAYGIPEEAATGTSNGALGGYLADKGYKDGAFSLTAYQGDGMDRPSRIFVKINSNPTQVWVGGRAVQIMSGQIQC